MRPKKFFTKVSGIIVILVLAVSLIAPVAFANGPIQPPAVAVELPAGGSTTIEKQVTTPLIPPTPDIYLLSDTTGSMGPSIGVVQANANIIMNDILFIDPNAQFGVGDYKDFPFDPYAFVHQQSITNDTSAVAAQIGNWVADGGGDGPEGQLYALHQIATDPGIGWRTGSSRIVVWFGDAPGHDPIPDAATGFGDLDEANVTAALVGAGIRVIAVSVTTGYPAGLDDDPTWGGGDYAFAYGIVEDGAPGQATRIAAATGGVALYGVAPAEVVNAIMAGLAGIKTDVWPTVVADPGLNVTFAPAVREDVDSGTMVTFQETISVDPGAGAGTLSAVVTFWANSYPAEGAPIGEQTITVTVPGEDGVPPVVEVGGDIYPVDKLAVLAPWILLAVAMIAGATIAVKRRRA